MHSVEPIDVLLQRALDVDKQTSSTGITPELQQEISDHTENLRFEFSARYFKLASKKVGKAMVYFSATSAIMLANKVHEYNLVDKSSFYTDVEKGFCRFVKFLRKNFKNQFDHSLCMPVGLWLPLLEHITLVIRRLESTSIDERLINVLKTEFNECGEEGPMTFAMGDYWQKLTGKLNSILPTTVSSVYTLIEYNFNSNYFVRFVIEWCAEMLKEGEATTDYWAETIKQVNRLATRSNMALNKRLPECKDVVLKALTMELCAVQPMALGNGCTPIQTNLTTGQLALLLKLQVATGMVIAENQMHFLNGAKDHFTLKQGKAISTDSLRVKFYSTDKASCKIVYEYLGNMMGELRKIMADI